MTALVARPSEPTLVVYTVTVTLAVALLAGTGRAGAGLALAVVLLATADLGPDRTLRVVAAALGALALAAAVDPAGDLPSGPLALVTLVLLGWSWPRLEAALGGFTAVALLGIAAVGVYLTVPDTEEIRVVAAVVIPGLALLSWSAVAERAPMVLAPLGLVVWAATQGGRGRPSAVIAALACVGLVAAPVAACRVTRSPIRRALILAAHGVATVVVARVAGLEASAATAAIIAAPVALGTVTADALVLRVAVDRRDRERVD